MKYIKCLFLLILTAGIFPGCISDDCGEIDNYSTKIKNESNSPPNNSIKYDEVAMAYEQWESNIIMLDQKYDTYVTELVSMAKKTDGTIPLNSDVKLKFEEYKLFYNYYLRAIMHYTTSKLILDHTTETEEGTAKICMETLPFVHPSGDKAISFGLLNMYGEQYMTMEKKISEMLSMGTHPNENVLDSILSYFSYADEYIDVSVKYTYYMVNNTILKISYHSEILIDDGNIGYLPFSYFEEDTNQDGKDDN